jgi:hypothetical protein
LNLPGNLTYLKVQLCNSEKVNTKVEIFMGSSVYFGS